jgi:hypothetical protein
MVCHRESSRPRSPERTSPTCGSARRTSSMTTSPLSQCRPMTVTNAPPPRRACRRRRPRPLAVRMAAAVSRTCRRRSREPGEPLHIHAGFEPASTPMGSRATPARAGSSSSERGRSAAATRLSAWCFVAKSESTTAMTAGRNVVSFRVSNGGVRTATPPTRTAGKYPRIGPVCSGFNSVGGRNTSASHARGRWFGPSRAHHPDGRSRTRTASALMGRA